MGNSRDIDTMKAGREMDALVAKEFTKAKGVHLVDFLSGVEDKEPTYPPYSTDISTAWKLFNGFPGYGIAFAHGYYACRIYLTNDRKDAVCSDAETAPLAICLAILKVVG